MTKDDSDKDLVIRLFAIAQEEVNALQSLNQQATEILEQLGGLREEIVRRTVQDILKAQQIIHAETVKHLQEALQIALRATITTEVKGSMANLQQAAQNAKESAASLSKQVKQLNKETSLNLSKAVQAFVYYFLPFAFFSAGIGVYYILHFPSAARIQSLEQAITKLEQQVSQNSQRRGKH